MPAGVGGFGRLLMMTGVLLFVVGLALTFLGRAGAGRLPGDIVVERGNITFYFPVVTSILLSLLLSGLLWLLRR
jgi:Protein of unknown function (DUF2905)